MGFRIKPKKSSSKTEGSSWKIVGEIRKSQSITTYGPGALIDFPRMSGIIYGIDDWESTLGKFSFEKMKIHERNLEKLLGKKFFIQPQMMDEKGFVSGISIGRFPEYCYCPECGALDRYYKIEKKPNNSTKYNRDSYCGMCSQTKGRNVKLIPSRFVISCKHGHMNDFPYEWWVHRKSGRCSNPKLSIEISKRTNSLDGIIVKCQCGASETLEGIMDRGALHQLRCFGEMPWLGKKEDYKGWYSELSGEACEEELRVLQRGANNVYYPCDISALTIPPFSSRIQRILGSDVEKLADYYKMPDDLKRKNLEYYFESHQSRLRCDWDQFNQELKHALGITDAGYRTMRDLMRGEYDALCDEDCDDPDFLTIETDVPEELSAFFEQIKIIGRLREVQVLKGFKRISQDESNMAPLSKKPLPWLPGIELYGEGIFIRFNESKVREWEYKNAKRYKALVKRAENNFIARDRISEGNLRYVLLHTAAHLLIRELTLQCGYTSASIKEKIYSSDSSEKPMCGILIYTASSDSDGSLGGLARQGVTEKVRDTVFSMLENASWCSNDPVCIDSRSQGYAALNYAACHACSLLPETSCECGNLLLDRGAIIGTSENPSAGYFYELLN